MKLRGSTMFSRTMPRTTSDLRFRRGRAIWGTHTPPLLLVPSAGWPPALGSKPSRGGRGPRDVGMVGVPAAGVDGRGMVALMRMGWNAKPIYGGMMEGVRYRGRA